MYMIDIYDDERQKELSSMVNCFTFVYMIGIAALLYTCIFPNFTF